MQINKERSDVNSNEINILEEEIDTEVIPEELELTDPDEAEQDPLDIEDVVGEDDEQHRLTRDERENYTRENEALVHFVAKKFQNTRIDHEELVDIAYLGFTKALNGYRKNREVKFSTYAHNCMYNEILFYLRKEKKHRENNVSLNNPVTTDKDGHVFDEESRISAVQDGKRSLEEDAVVTQAIEFLNEIIDDLSETEQLIIKSRFGLKGAEIRTQKEIADEINMSQANISKLEKTIISKISKLLTARYGLESLDI